MSFLFRICYNLLLVRDIYVLVSSLEHCRICMFGFRNIYFSVLFRTFPLFVSVPLLLCVFLLLISELPVLYSFNSFFSSFFLTTFFSSNVFSFIILSRTFLSVIAVMYFDINNSSADIALKLHTFSISISRLQNSSGVSSSPVCFAQKKSPRLW